MADSNHDAHADQNSGGGDGHDDDCAIDGFLRCFRQLIQDQVTGLELLAIRIEQLAAGATLEVIGNAGVFEAVFVK